MKQVTCGGCLIGFPLGTGIHTMREGCAHAPVDLREAGCLCDEIDPTDRPCLVCEAEAFLVAGRTG